MARTVGRSLAAPLLFLNLIMYFIVLGFASWCLNHYINGQTNHPSKLSIPFFPILLLLFMHVHNKKHYCKQGVHSFSLVSHVHKSMFSWFCTFFSQIVINFVVLDPKQFSVFLLYGDSWNNRNYWRKHYSVWDCFSSFVLSTARKQYSIRDFFMLPFFLVF